MTDIESRCFQVVAELLGLKPDDVKLESRFIEDLGVDSLDQIKMVMDFEEECGIKSSDAEANKITTVQKAVDVVRRKLG